MLRSSSAWLLRRAVPATVGMAALGLGREEDNNDEERQQRRPSRRVAHAWAGGGGGSGADGFSKWADVGLPGGDTTYLFKENFVVCYDARTRNPKWVMERVSRATTTGDADRKVMEFYEEAGIVDPRFRTRNEDYLMSGWDRGHLAPAANNRASAAAMAETFTLANISPQAGPGFNRDYWARFEKFTRDLTKACETVYIVSGPLFLPQRRTTTNNNHSNNPASRAQWVMGYELIGETPTALVSVPTHFYKVVLGERKGDGRRLVAAFVLPNAAIPAEMPLSNFLVPLDNLERVAGLRFFAQSVTEAHRDLLDARVPLLRGSNPNPHVAGLLTDGSAAAGGNGKGKGKGRGGGGGGGGWGGGDGGLRLQLDGPEHLCDVLACQLPAENFWEKNVPKPLPDGGQQQQQGGGKGRGRGKGRRAVDDSGVEDAPPPPAKSSSWW